MKFAIIYYRTQGGGNLIKIMLVCSAGMSTSLLVTKMNRVIKEKNLDAEAFAVAEADVKNYIDKADVVLLGPQVRYLLNKMQDTFKDTNVKVGIIETVNYGTMNGEKVLEQAMNLLEN